MSDSTALVIADVQRDFCPGGALETRDGNLVAERIAELVRGDHDYRLVLASRDWHIDPGVHYSIRPDYQTSWPVHCRAETPGAEFHPAIQALLDEGLISATFPKGQYTPVLSAFEGACNGVLLGEYLAQHNISEIHVAGIATEFTVKQTVLEGLRHNLDVSVLTNHISSLGETTGPHALEEMTAVGAKLLAL